MAQDCLGRTPFASLIACMICLVGAAVFCGASFRGIDFVLRGIFEGLFRFTIPWLFSLQITAIILGIVAGAFSIMLLVFGFLATGATRQNIYSGTKCIMGGRISAAFFMIISYILNIIWVGVSSTMVVPIIIYIMLRSICINEIEDREPWYLDNYCLNLTRFGIYRSGRFPEIYEPVDGSKNAICDATELGKFCQLVNDAGPMFALAFGGAGLIVLALVLFLCTMSMNQAKVSSTKEISEYRQAIALDTNTM